MLPKGLFWQLQFQIGTHEISVPKFEMIWFQIVARSNLWHCLAATQNFAQCDILLFNLVPPGTSIPFVSELQNLQFETKVAKWALSLVLLHQIHACCSHNTKLCGYKQPAHQTTDTQAYCSECMNSSL